MLAHARRKFFEADMMRREMRTGSWSGCGNSTILRIVHVSSLSLLGKSFVLQKPTQYWIR